MNYNKQQEPMVLYPATYAKLLSMNNPDVIALFTFYYYTAKYQETMSIRCTVSFASKGLGLTKDRIRKAKALLVTAGFIQEKQEHSTDGTFKQGYIILSLAHTPHYGIPDYGYPDSGKQETNAYTSNKRKKKIIKKENYSEVFEELWEMYPKKKGKAQAYESWKCMTEDEQSEARVKLKEYVQEQEASNTELVYYKNLSTWLNQRRWEDEYCAASNKPRTKSDIYAEIARLEKED